MQGDELKGAKVTAVIETKITRGDGSEKSPVREVIQYWGLNGEFLAEMDSQYLAVLAKKEIREAAETFKI